MILPIQMTGRWVSTESNVSDHDSSRNHVTILGWRFGSFCSC